jgi:hypothetical protein
VPGVVKRSWIPDRRPLTLFNCIVFTLRGVYGNDAKDALMPKPEVGRPTVVVRLAWGASLRETLICVRTGIAVDQVSLTRYPLLRPK